MAENDVKNTAGVKTANFLENNKKGLIGILVAVIVILAAYIVFTAVSSGATEKNLSKIDEISYTLTNESSALDETELSTRRADALKSLEPFVKKGGVSGVRANLLAAEVCYENKDYDNAIVYWRNAAAAGKKSYTAPLAYFNMASAYEEINNLDEAAKNYKAAADYKDFIMKAHAMFNYGRVLEAQGKTEEAVAAYKDLFAKLPDDAWAKLAKTRLIVLDKAE